MLVHLSFEHLWGALISLILAILGWRELDRRDDRAEMKKDIDAAHAAADKAAAALALHQLYAAENFARKADLEKMEGRLMKRLDEIRDAVAPRD